MTGCYDVRTVRTVWFSVRRCVPTALAVASIGALGCGAASDTGTFIVDVSSGSQNRIGGDGTVLWPPGTGGPIVWTTEHARVYDATGDETRSIDLKNASEDSFAVSGDRYAYVSLDDDPGVPLLAVGDLVTGTLGGDDPRVLLQGATRPWFTDNGQAILTARASKEPLRALGDNAPRQLVRAPLSGARPTPVAGAPSSTILAVLGSAGVLFDRATEDRDTVVLQRPDGRTRTVAANRIWRTIDFSARTSRLLYTSSSGGGLAIGGLRGTEPSRIARGTYLTARWAPDSRRIAATTYDGRILNMKPDGTDVATVSDFKGRWPTKIAWAPDGRSLAVTVEEPPAPSD